MKKLIAVLSIFFGLAACAFGQTALTTTTLSAAVTSTSTTTLRVASATGIVANSTVLFIEDGTSNNSEAAFVNSVSGTAIGVTRGYNGTKVSTHISGALVFAGTPDKFYSFEPGGSCTAAQQPVTPFINVLTGNAWLCSTISLQWVPGFWNTASAPGVTTVVASAAGQVTPSGPLFHISGALAITGFTSGTGMGGLAASTVGAPFCVIPDGAFTWTATNNIAVAGTAVVNRQLCWSFDQTNKKYVPSYV